MTPTTHRDGVGRLGVAELRAAYRDARLTPADVVDVVHDRIAALALATGRSVLGFVGEQAGLETATDITGYGGWRACQDAVAATSWQFWMAVADLR